jgi:hypothetical protein
VLLAEVNNLKYAYGRTRMPLVQLTDDTFAPLPDNSYPTYAALLNDMSNITKYAKGLGPFKATLLGNYNVNNGTITPGTPTSSGIVERAHEARLQVGVGARRLCMQAGGACFQVTTCSSAFNTALFTACTSSHSALWQCQHKDLALHASKRWFVCVVAQRPTGLLDSGHHMHTLQQTACKRVPVAHCCDFPCATKVASC